MKRVVLIYAGLLVVFGLVICLALEWGQLSFHPHPSATTLSSVTRVALDTPGDSSRFWSALQQNIEAPLGPLFLQFIVISLCLPGNHYRSYGYSARSVFACLCLW